MGFVALYSFTANEKYATRDEVLCDGMMDYSITVELSACSLTKS